MKSWIFISLLFITSMVFGQQSVKVKLKNGNIVRGKLIEYIDGDHLIMELYQDQTVTISLAQIHKMKNSHYTLINETGEPRKYYNLTSLGVTFIKTDYGLEGLDWNLHTLNGINITHNYMAGLGVGIDRYGELSSVPVYIGGRGEFGKGHVAPTVFTNLGYGHMWVKNNRTEFSNIMNLQGGIYWELGAGITFRNKTSRLSVQLAYKSQAAQVDYAFFDWWGGNPSSFKEKRKFRNMALTFAVAF